MDCKLEDFNIPSHPKLKFSTWQEEVHLARNNKQLPSPDNLNAAGDNFESELPPDIDPPKNAIKAYNDLKDINDFLDDFLRKEDDSVRTYVGMLCSEILPLQALLSSQYVSLPLYRCVCWELRHWSVARESFRFKLLKLTSTAPLEVVHFLLYFSTGNIITWISLSGIMRKHVLQMQFSHDCIIAQNHVSEIYLISADLYIQIVF